MEQAIAQTMNNKMKINSLQKHILLLIFISTFTQNIYSQTEYYEKAFVVLKQMLEGTKEVDFKKALFTVENAWYNDSLNYSDFDSKIKVIADSCRKMVAKKGIERFKTSGNWAIFMYMTKPVPENNNQAYKYNFEDFLGDNDYSNTFVNRILKDGKGTCLSLPLLYKCIAQKLGIEAQLTIGPSHAWIRHTDEQGKWTNVELTSGQLPTDGVMITELNIKIEAIKSGAYFNPLTEKESIAFLLTQLAQGYEHKFKRLDYFTDKCSDLSIQYYAPNVIAYMCKSNHLAYVLQNKNIDEKKRLKTKTEYLEIQKKLLDIGADTISPKEYNNWVSSMQNRKE